MRQGAGRARRAASRARRRRRLPRRAPDRPRAAPGEGGAGAVPDDPAARNGHGAAGVPLRIDPQPHRRHDARARQRRRAAGAPAPADRATTSLRSTPARPTTRSTAGWRSWRPTRTCTSTRRTTSCSRWSWRSRTSRRPDRSGLRPRCVRSLTWVRQRSTRPWIAGAWPGASSASRSRWHWRSSGATGWSGSTPPSSATCSASSSWCSACCTGTRCGCGGRRRPCSTVGGGTPSEGIPSGTSARSRAWSATHLLGQGFIRRRSRSRWLAHQLVFWGCILAALVTFPLTLGLLHFQSVGQQADRYQVYLSRIGTMQFDADSIVAGSSTTRSTSRPCSC